MHWMFAPKHSFPVGGAPTGSLCNTSMHGIHTDHTETQAESTVRVVEKRRGEYCSGILHVCLFL